jgi:hypothetical protein
MNDRLMLVGLMFMHVVMRAAGAEKSPLAWPTDNWHHALPVVLLHSWSHAVRDGQARPLHGCAPWQ